MIPALDSDYLARLIERLERLDSAAKPRWGLMRGDQLIPHFVGTFETSMGRHPTGLPFTGNWVTRKVVFPLAVHGVLPVPKNLKLKSAAGQQIPLLVSPGDAHTLRALATEFISSAGAGTVKTTWHPIFGDIGADGWLRIHRMHCEHHMKQFGL